MTNSSFSRLSFVNPLLWFSFSLQITQTILVLRRYHHAHNDEFCIIKLETSTKNYYHLVQISTNQPMKYRAIYIQQNMSKPNPAYGWVYPCSYAVQLIICVLVALMISELCMLMKQRIIIILC